MKSDVKGCSTCKAGQENYEYFTSYGRKYVQYDYRAPDGELFSTVARNLEIARQRRDAWLRKREA